MIVSNAKLAQRAKTILVAGFAAFAFHVPPAAAQY